MKGFPPLGHSDIGNPSNFDNLLFACRRRADAWFNKTPLSEVGTILDTHLYFSELGLEVSLNDRHQVLELSRHYQAMHLGVDYLIKLM